MSRSHRRSQLLVAVSLGVLALVSAGCIEEPVTQIQGPTITGSMSLDADHTISTQLVTVSLNDVAAAMRGDSEVAITRTDGTAAWLVVAPIDPSGAAGTTPTAGTIPATPSSLVSPNREIGPGSSATFPIDCYSACERTFRLIAEADPSHLQATVTWSGSGSLTYMGNSYPSGADVSLRTDPAIAVDGQGRALQASVSDNTIELDATHPAAARIAEVALAADAVPANASDAITLAVLTAHSDSGSQVIMTVQPTIPPSGSTAAPLLVGAQFGAQLDPLTDCQQGADCVRQFLISAVWDGRGPERISWSLGVSQIRLGGDGAASGSLSAATVRSVEVSGPPVGLHLEGDLTVEPGSGVVLTSQTDVQVAMRVGSGDQPDWFGLLPVPGLARLTTVAAPGPGRDSNVGVICGLFDDVVNPQTESSGDPCTVPDATITRLSLGEDPMSIRVYFTVDQSNGQLAAPLTVHWTLDLDVYQYDGLPPIEPVAVPGP